MFISGSELKDKLKAVLENQDGNLILISAYLKSDTLKALIPFIKNRNTKIFARWQTIDLLRNVSDIDVYNLCKTQGYEFYINPSLHAKMAIINNELAIIGSSNYTPSGTGQGHKNIEWNFVLERQLNPIEFQEIYNSLKFSRKVDDDLFESIVNELESFKLPYEESKAFIKKIPQAPKAIGRSKSGITDLFPPFSSIDTINPENPIHLKYLHSIDIFNPSDFDEIAERIIQSEIGVAINRLILDKIVASNEFPILRWGDVRAAGYDPTVLSENDGLGNLFAWMAIARPNEFEFFSNRPNGTCSIKRIAK
jgi:hypothetical protein